ncbi:SMI1/KNR4 family protein [Psychrobacter sp. B38]|uniref:SMI1/KNR4 family protein n=1 Tax=Psychrobacter sp. B38 TaxID=3143538 RepID=UPI00320CF5F6
MFNEGSPESKIINTFDLMSIKELPVGYKEFLRISNGAFLFLNKKYGQAGLNFYNLEEFENKVNFWLSSYRSNSLIKGDLIIGEFLGDSDFVILRCDQEADDYGAIVISHPYDERKNWFYVKDGFTKFLSDFVRAEGDKYWELI